MKNLLHWILKNGGPLRSSTWCKITLSWFGLYDKKGIPSILPEIFLMPRWLPFHPANYWVMSRNTFLAMAYLYRGKSLPRLDLLSDLREELFEGHWDNIKFEDHLFLTGPTDSLHPISNVAKFFCYLTKLVVPFIPKSIIEKGIKKVLRTIRLDIANSNGISFSPVSISTGP